MKKRTKITLTIVGLLALTGALYAANPSPFVTGIPFTDGRGRCAGSFARFSILQRGHFVDRLRRGMPRCSRRSRGSVPAGKNTWL